MAGVNALDGSGMLWMLIDILSTQFCLLSFMFAMICNIRERWNLQLGGLGAMHTQHIAE